MQFSCRSLRAFWERLAFVHRYWLHTPVSDISAAGSSYRMTDVSQPSDCDTALTLSVTHAGLVLKHV